ncbi:MAG: acyl-protein synthetase [Methylacidiphilaceae bacterium]|nr:acyl-protein synthetase [Candidatus Methylacidiphilaceae bacterium]
MAKEKSGFPSFCKELDRPEGRAQWGKSLQSLSVEDERGFEGLALALCRSQARRVAPLARLLQAEGGVPTGWRRIPPVPQELFKQVRLFVPADQAPRRIFETSGTTRQNPGRHFLLDVDLYRAVSTEGARRAGVPWETVDLHFLVPSPPEAPHSSLSAMFGFWSEQSVHPSRFWIQDGRLDQKGLLTTLSEAVRSGRPVGLCGTAFAFVPLLEQGEGSALCLPRGSFLLETGGFKGRAREMSKPDFYRALEARFGISAEEIWSEYGMTELSSQAYAQGPDGVHRTPPWARVRIIDPLTGRDCLTGEKGLVAWVDLANIDSVLAIQTQDEAIAAPDGFRLLGRSPTLPLRGCSLTAEDLRSS